MSISYFGIKGVRSELSPLCVSGLLIVHMKGRNYEKFLPFLVVYAIILQDVPLRNEIYFPVQMTCEKKGLGVYTWIYSNT